MSDSTAPADPTAPDAAGSGSAGSDPQVPDPAARPAHPQPVVSNRILTIPNALSFLRLLGVPLFFYLLVGPQYDGWAFVVLAISAITDYADGKLARLLDQYSRLGALLDPAADRLYILAALIGFVIRGFIPWWVAVLIIGRDVLLAATLPVLRRYGYTALPVHYLGKAATFCLFYGLPMLLIAQGDSLVAQIALPTSYAFITWGVVMYLWAGAIYFRQLGWIIKNCPLAPRFRPPNPPAAAGNLAHG